MMPSLPHGPTRHPHTPIIYNLPLTLLFYTLTLLSNRTSLTSPLLCTYTAKMTETVRCAFADRERPLLSYGIPFPASAKRHVTRTFNAARVYIICSGSLARNTDSLQQLKTALGEDRVAGVRVGMKSHTLWSEVVEIVQDARRVAADLIITLGAGSLTDGAKIVALVFFLDIYRLEESMLIWK